MYLLHCVCLLLFFVNLGQGESCADEYEEGLVREKRAIPSIGKYCLIGGVNPIRGIVKEIGIGSLDKAYHVVDQHYNVHSITRKFGKNFDAFEPLSEEYWLIGKGIMAREPILWAYSNGTKSFYYLYNSSDSNEETGEYWTDMKYVSLVIGNEKHVNSYDLNYFTTIVYGAGWAMPYTIEFQSGGYYLRNDFRFPRDVWGKWYWYFTIGYTAEELYKKLYTDELAAYYIIPKQSEGYPLGPAWILYTNGKYAYYKETYEYGMATWGPDGGPNQFTVIGANRTIKAIKLLVFDPYLPYEKAWSVLDGMYRNYSVVFDDISLKLKPSKYINKAMVESIRNRKPISALTNMTTHYWALEKGENWNSDDPKVEFRQFPLFYGQDKKLPHDGNDVPFRIPVFRPNGVDMYEFDAYRNDSESSVGGFGNWWIHFKYNDQLVFDMVDYYKTFNRYYNTHHLPYYILTDDKEAIVIFKNGSYAYLDMRDLNAHRIWSTRPYSSKFMRTFRYKNKFNLFG